MAKRKKQMKKEPAPPVAGSKKSLKDIRLPGWAYAVCLACVLAVVAFTRFSHLSYDPPVDIFWSQDLWTDPPQYTSYARNAVLFGDSNPLHENMYLPFRRNSMGALAYPVFLITGAGFWQSNLVAVLFNLGAIIVFSLAITRLKNRTAGVLCAFLLGINYIFLTYGRVPFLENAMNFWLALGVYFAARGLDRPRWALATGLALGLAAFFGKMIALHALPVFLLFAVFIGWRHASGNNKKWYLPAVYLAAGIGIVAAFWYPLVYAQIEGSYFAEKSTGVYGAPEGLQSVSGFFNRVFSFGSDTRLFVRLPVMAIFGFFGVALAFLRLGSTGKFTERLKRIKPEYLLLGLWFWAAYFALMPWNYRPLRYETVLLIPLAGAAAMVLSDLVRRRKTSVDRPTGRSLGWSTALGVLFFASPIYHLVTARWGTPVTGAADGRSALLAIVIAAAGAFILSAGHRKIADGWRRLRMSTRIPEIIIALVVIVTLVIQVPMIRNWWAHGQQAMTNASRDLAKILGPDAVLVGSYATGLTLENNHKNVVYMFGVTNVNYTLFDDYPITHLAVIDDNKQSRTFTDYPEIAGPSRRVSSYVIGNRPVGIFRVAEHSRNRQAKAYQPTAYEHAMRCYDQYNEDSMLIYIEQFVRENPDNFSVARFRGLRFMRDSTFDSATYYFAKAAELYPDDYAVQYNLGHCAMLSFEQNGNTADLLTAREHFAEVLRLKPNDATMRARLEPIIGR